MKIFRQVCDLQRDRKPDLSRQDCVWVEFSKKNHNKCPIIVFINVTQKRIVFHKRASFFKRIIPESTEKYITDKVVTSYYYDEDLQPYINALLIGTHPFLVLRSALDAATGKRPTVED